MVCWFSGHVKAECGIVDFGFDMPTSECPVTRKRVRPF